MANHRDAHLYHSRTVNGPRISPPYWREGTQYGVQATHDYRSNGFADKGSSYEVVPVVEEPSSSGGSFFSSWFSGPGFWGGKNSNARTEGGYSAGGTSGAGNERVHNYRGPKSEYPDRVFESRGVNGDYSRTLGDLPRVPVQERTSSNEIKVNHERIESLQNRIKKVEEELRTVMTNYHRERIRAEGFEEENRKSEGELQVLYRENRSVEKDNRELRKKLEALSPEKARADAFEKDNQELRKKLEVLSQEKARADAIGKENQSKLDGLYREKARTDDLEKEIREIQEGLRAEKVRADTLERENTETQRKLAIEKVRADRLESENREFQVKLEKDEQEIRELQSKLQEALTAKELEAAESRTLQNSLKDIRLENQKLNSWKLERERKTVQVRKTVQDTSPIGQYRTKVADLTYAKGQLEKKEQQLTNQNQEQAKRIEDLKQRNAALEVKMGASESQVQSLLERLHDEREKPQQRNTEVEDLKQQLKAQVVVADKEALVYEQEARELALRAQCSVLEQQLQSKELETRSLSLTLSNLNERMRQYDLEIDVLKRQTQGRENRGSQEFAVALPKQYVGGESFLESEATPYLLDGAVQRVHEAAGIFSRLLIKAMEQGKIDGTAVARNQFVRSVSVGKAAPLKYVLEAIMCKILFQSFEHECFELQESSSGFLDMELQRVDNFQQYKDLNSIESPEQLVLTEDSLFTQFCRTRLEFLSAAIPEIDSMVLEMISRTFDRSFSSETSIDVATDPASKLGSTFVKLAVCVWQVHKLAFAFNPVARIFRVAQREKFVEKYMDSLISLESESEDEDTSKVDISRIDFMVVPGFLINRIVIRSRVFVIPKLMQSAFRKRNGEAQTA